MPKRQDLKKILVLGSGPILIGQGSEFDYSGTQATRALMDEGFEVVLVNSNPATIMTDAAMATSTYIEPLTAPAITAVIEKERPNAILPTMGGQTALNCALELHEAGILERYNVALIGASVEAIEKAENRELFRLAMQKIGLKMPKARVAHHMQEAWEVQKEVGFPTVIRPSFTLGGSGGGIASDAAEFEEICSRGFALSPTHELLIEESIAGWKEFEMEVVRDRNDNAIIVCAIENIDPMGVHTGDSITVAPAQTLSDKEFHVMREASLAVIREIGVETGGANVQFAVHPGTGELRVIEMNPRVSRSSALASKATGFPIAKISAKLAVGYTLDELRNEMTGNLTPAAFEPALDYVVTKIPRFNFEKFPQVEPILGTQMRAVGEVMGIGRTFQESFQKAIRSLETGLTGLDERLDLNNKNLIIQNLKTASPLRFFDTADAMRAGFSIDEIYDYTKIDHWFLNQIQAIVEQEKTLLPKKIMDLSKAELLAFKQAGFSDARLAKLLKCHENEVRQKRYEWQIRPSFKAIDSTAGEFDTTTCYFYSSYDAENEVTPATKKTVIVLGSGPNRIGQGIEFDYCCVQSIMRIRERGLNAVMVNCNPETVSTDYDIADRLYFEPLTLEDVLEVIHQEQPIGVVLQFGGQTPLKLAQGLEAAGVTILGTSKDSIDCAEDRARFNELVNRLQLKQPPGETASHIKKAIMAANRLGYPLLLRPSYVLGGRAMEIINDELELISYFQHADILLQSGPILIDRFLDDATEVDVDALSDGKQVFIGGIMEHIEQAGIHSGDSACVIPPHNLSEAVQQEIRDAMCKLSLALNVKGTINAQFAVKNNEVYLLEVNPRASRTLPFVSKAIGRPLVKIATDLLLGDTLNIPPLKKLNYFAVKEAVFPFIKFQGVDPILGPEMRSTGEVMGLGLSFGEAFLKSQIAAGNPILTGKQIFISVRDADKAAAAELARAFVAQGFEIVATEGTAAALAQAGINCIRVKKVREGKPSTVDLIVENKLAFIINTVEGRQAILDSGHIRRAAVLHNVNHTTTLAGAWATLEAYKALGKERVYRLQSDIYEGMEQ